MQWRSLTASPSSLPPLPSSLTRLWGVLAKACFPVLYAESQAGDKAAVKARHKELTSGVCLMGGK